MKTFKLWSDIPFKFKGWAYIESDGTKTKYDQQSSFRTINNLDDPALIWPDGTEEYYIHSICYSKERWFVHPVVVQRRFHFVCLFDVDGL